MNYYLVNLSIADLMITIWCPVQSLVRELSQHNHYILPAIFCKIGVFYTGNKSLTLHCLGLYLINDEVIHCILSMDV